MVLTLEAIRKEIRVNNLIIWSIIFTFTGGVAGWYFGVWIKGHKPLTTFAVLWNSLMISLWLFVPIKATICIGAVSVAACYFGWWYSRKILPEFSQELRMLGFFLALIWDLAIIGALFFAG